MIKVSADLDTRVFDDIQSTISRSGKLMSRAFQRDVTKVRQQFERDVANEPPQAPLPFVWSSNPQAQARARAYYFANKVPRGSRGGRYKRTHKLAKSWKFKIDLKDAAGVITATNDTPGAEYVIGDRQVVSHRIAGWYTDEELRVKYSAVLTERCEQTWRLISDPVGSVRA